MNDFVNALDIIQKDIQASGISFRYDECSNLLQIISPNNDAISLKLTPLYRPSSSDVVHNATPDSLLVIAGATKKAALAASHYNHILVPKGGYRIIAPGIALTCASTSSTDMDEARQVRLTGRTGVVAESLLLGGKRSWSVTELAAASHVSPGLAQRVINRLQHETLLSPSGFGREKKRTVSNPKALAELWSQEEKVISPALRGYLYGSSIETAARIVLDTYPGSAVGKTIAAHLYKPVLTRVTPPIQVWVPASFDRSALKEHGFQETHEGANVDIITFKNDPWQIHRNAEGFPRVSKWRAWIEISHEKGRVQELADALFADLEEQWHGAI